MKKQVKNALSVRDFLNLGSNYRDIGLLKLSIKRITRSEAERHLLERYFYLLVNTDYFRAEAYEVLVKRKTYKEVAERYGLKENYLRNLVHYEVRKIYEDVTEDPYALVRYRDYVEDKELKKDLVEILADRIDLLISNHNIVVAENIEEYMVVDMGEYSDIYREYDGNIDDELFAEMVERLKYLSKPYLNMLFKRIDERTLGYIVYLLITKDSNLSERDRENKKYVKEAWFIP